jgi:erythromycin esterase-like protein
MVGIYGLDLYSLNASIEIIISYLEKVDQEAAIRAKKRYACFEDFKEELDSYGFSTILGIRKSCEEAVIEQLNELNQNSDLYLNDNCLAEDEFFNIQQNAWLVKNAEQYYRSMFSTSSWNMRDSHMAATLDKLANYLGKKLGRPAKIIVWAHNSHIGDARATESAQEGQLNIGQLTREKYGNKVALIGLLTYSGTVTAASVWDGATERKFVRPALSNSYEHLFHHMNIPDFFLNIRDHNQHYLDKGLLERAIGVIYAPETERLSHYFYANLAKQFDAVIYLDNTTALKPLETTAIWHRGEVYETFPSGF